MSRSLLVLPLLAVLCISAEPEAKKAPKAALQEVQDLIGSWRGTGEPSQGTREEKQKNFWTETIAWEWQFKGDDVFLKATFDKSKHFKRGEMRYLPEKAIYRLTLVSTADEKLTFDGTYDGGNKKLVLERTDEKKNETQMLRFSLLHDNRHLYLYAVRAAGRESFTPVYQVGATKQGVDFASSDGKPECVVSGGLGTIKVDYKGKTYYVCCSGCRDAFKDDPEKYIKEFEERKAKKKSGDAKQECMVLPGAEGTISVEYKGKKYHICCVFCLPAFLENPERYIKEAEMRKAMGE